MTPPRPTLAHFVIPLAGALTLIPGAPPSAALVGGGLIAIALGNPYLAWTKRATHPLLSTAVVGLGAAMNLRVVVQVGAHGIVYTLVGITLTLALGVALGRAWKVPPDTGLLISVGTAICGGSAIAAVVPILRAKDHEVSIALATVFLLNAAALVLFPPIGHALGFDQTRFGIWAALAIHDTSSVVGAAAQYGKQALQVATTIKLTRTLWIVPLCIAIAEWRRRTTGAAEKGKARRPWFILGFLAAAALVTFVPSLQPAGELLARIARQLLVLTLFLIGVNVTRATLRTVGARPLALGFSLWVVVASATLGAIAAGWIS